ncbi:MAG: epoxide hydrolase [Bacteroidetes bacterium]|nr:epoxide hydrolase [Bacteroidota bacterium]
MSGDVKSFKINIPDKEVTNLKNLLAATRWPDEVHGADWDYGANLSYMKELVAFWQKKFDWKKQEAMLNQFNQYVVAIDSIKIHFVYEKGKGKTSTPIVLLHGWPSSFVQMLKIIPLLTRADESGHSFDVIVPSLIGYGFSGKATEKGMTVYQMAELYQKLVTEKLGYQQFMIRASDIGAGVAKEWAISHPQNIIGLHLSGSNPYTFQVPQDLSEAEKSFLQKGQQFMQGEGAYAMQQSTKPQTLAFGLNNSPVGLAAWIIEKFNTWSDNGGNLENKFSKDELLTNISIYWFTQTIGSSMRSYYESAHVWSPNANKKVEVPTAFMMLEKDIAVGPREWEARTYNITRWKLHASGGHFGEWEEPNVIANDIIDFSKSLK